MLLLPETKAADAAVLLERVRVKVKEIRFDEGLNLSMSCGIAEYDAEMDSPPPYAPPAAPVMTNPSRVTPVTPVMVTTGRDELALTVRTASCACGSRCSRAISVPPKPP